MLKAESVIESQVEQAQSGSLEKVLLGFAVALALCLCGMLSWGVMLLSFREGHNRSQSYSNNIYQSNNVKWQVSNWKTKHSQQGKPPNKAITVRLPRAKLKHFTESNNQIVSTKEVRKEGVNKNILPKAKGEALNIKGKGGELTPRLFYKELEGPKGFNVQVEMEESVNKENAQEDNARNKHATLEARSAIPKEINPAEKNSHISEKANDGQRLIKQSVLNSIIEAIDEQELEWATELLQQYRESTNADMQHQSGSTLLMKAVSSRNIQLVKKVLELSPNLEALDNYCNTALTLAIKNGSADIVSLLIKSGALLGETNALTTAQAASKPGVEELHETTQAQALDDTTTCNKQSLPTPIEVASQNCDHKIIKTLLLSGANPNQQTTDGKTPLIIASELGCIKAVETLVRGGAKVGLSNGNGRTALAYASKGNQQEIIRILIQNGADATEKDYTNNSPIDTAFKAESFQSIKAMIEADWEERLKSQKNNLQEAASTGQLNTITSLLEKGQHINQTDERGQTPLMYAILSKQREAAALLVNKDADVNYVDKTNQTPLTLAAWTGNEWMVKMLLQNNANVNYRNEYGETPLMKAVQGKNKKIVELMLVWGGLINTTDNNGNTALTLAVLQEDFDIAKMLLERGAPVNTPNKQGRTPLFYAQGNKSSKVAELLLNFGAKVNVKDVNGNTPLMWTTECRNPFIASLMVKRSGVVNQVNQLGQTPILAAATQSNIQLIKVFEEALSKITDAIKHTDFRGRNILMIAAQAGNKAATSYAIKSGRIPVNSQDELGNTALMYAVFANSLECASILMKNGANPLLRNKAGKTAVDIASTYRKSHFIPVLLRKEKMGPHKTIRYIAIRPVIKPPKDVRKPLILLAAAFAAIGALWTINTLAKLFKKTKTRRAQALKEEKKTPILTARQS